MGYFQRSNPGCCIKSKNDFSKNTAETVSDACTLKSPNFPGRPPSAPVRQDPAPLKRTPKVTTPFQPTFVCSKICPYPKTHPQGTTRLFNGAAKVAGFFIPAIFCQSFANLFFKPHPPKEMRLPSKAAAKIHLPMRWDARI